MDQFMFNLIKSIMKTINLNKIDKLSTEDIPVMFWYAEMLKYRAVMKEMPSDYLFRRLLMRQSLLACFDTIQMELEYNPIYKN